MVIKQMLIIIIITDIFIIINNRWMCDVSLKDRKRSEALYSLGVQSVAEMVRQGIIIIINEIFCNAPFKNKRRKSALQLITST